LVKEVNSCLFVSGGLAKRECKPDVLKNTAKITNLKNRTIGLFLWITDFKIISASPLS